MTSEYTPEQPASELEPAAVAAEPAAPEAAAVPPAAAAPAAAAANPNLQRQRASQLAQALRGELQKALIGQTAVIDDVLSALIAGGHVLIEGVPGLGKTLLVRALARCFGGEFARIQFTPDLMPSDVTGHAVYDMQSEQFKLRKGPVFTNLLLADEINRTPPRTQAALLEAMEERRVTVEGTARQLPTPFMVVATQNPVEYEGTYPLPEAQLDRFLFKLVVGYPSPQEEHMVLTRHDGGMNPHDLPASGIGPVAGAAELAAAREHVEQLRTDPAVLGYVVDLATASRQSPSLTLGISPRGSTMLLKAAKAWAWLSGREYVTPDDVKAMALPALRHRVQVRPDVELEGGDADTVLQGILAAVPVPR
ncbi:MoxR family ATPase [Pseudomonas sp.]|uniref:AAA family ATPase n=1 Tax=Pseudomonas sp. TaxID=306 RepID=UPI002D169E2F|nr:MoxR family ATPase [Pseudomonas sp.]HUE90476.1 MoxR family ATPase [Pseudomonas sp.]